MSVDNKIQPKNFKILIVDDFEMGRQILKSALFDLGYTNVSEAEDGLLAVESLKEAKESGPFSVIFCDWNMPNMNGLQVLQTVRKDDVYAKLPFVMVTAEADQENIVTALSAGASDYVVKPITPEILKVKLERIVGKLQARAAA